VAKTTTVHCLGVALAEEGKRVLVVDLDPQACLTFSLGLDPDDLGTSLHDVLVRRAKMADVRREVPGVEGLCVIPATIDLAGAEVHLLSRTGREHVLARALQPILPDHDVVLIDCPPSLGVLTINGLTAAEMVLIPLQCEALSHRGVGQLLETIEDVRQFANDKLGVLGVVPTMYDGRTTHARKVLSEVGERYGLRVFEPPCPSRSASPKPPSSACPSCNMHPRHRERRPTVPWPCRSSMRWRRADMARPREGRPRIRSASGPCTGRPRPSPAGTNPVTRRPRCSPWANGRCIRGPAPKRMIRARPRTIH
jgi:chromosome partitioning protein